MLTARSNGRWRIASLVFSLFKKNAADQVAKLGREGIASLSSHRVFFKSPGPGDVRELGSNVSRPHWVLLLIKIVK